MKYNSMNFKVQENICNQLISKEKFTFIRIIRKNYKVLHALNLIYFIQYEHSFIILGHFHDNINIYAGQKF